MSDAGYNNYYAVLNASDYGIPQHRERVFIVSIRKDIDRDKFAFPQKEPLRLRVKDLLEYEVEEKYYIDTDRARELIRKLAEEGKLPERNKAGTLGTHETDRVWNENGITPSLKGTDHKNPVKIALKQVGETGPHQTDRVYDAEGCGRTLKATEHIHPMKIVLKQIGEIGSCQSGRIYDSDGCCPTLNTAQGGQKQPKIITAEPAIAAMRGRNPDNPGDRHSSIPTEQRLEINTSGTSNTITTVQKDNCVIEVLNPEKDGTCRTLVSSYYKTSPANLESNLSRSSSGAVEKIDTGCKAVGDLKVGGERGLVYDAEKSMCTLSATQYKDPHKVLNEYRIRKLTPKECWRLMGFDDDDFEKAKAAGISNTQLYKQAGNSIVVQVLERIFEKLIETQGIGDGNE